MNFAILYTKFAHIIKASPGGQNSKTVLSLSLSLAGGWDGWFVNLKRWKTVTVFDGLRVEGVAVRLRSNGGG